MKIAFNPSTVAALTAPPNNKDITFDLRGRNIFARGVKFQGTDTNTWRSIQVNGISIGTNTLNIVGATTSTKDGITSIITKDTWRQIKINNISIGTNILDLRNGSNTTLTNSNGVVTINSTWRPVVDSLTSDSTTSSLSAKQGKVLAGLINGKSDSGHTHDGRYVRAFGTTNDDIDSDWGQSFKTFDPIPSGTPPEKNPNISLLSIGENFNRRKQLAFIYSNDNIYYRRHVNGSFTDWRRLAFANEIPGSLKNPYALTISLNGTSQGPYDGSAAKSINITPGSIGAATNDHNHDERYLALSGGWMSGDINFGGNNSIAWIRNTDSASISFKNDGDADSDSYMSFVTSDNGNEYFRWSHSSGSTNTEWMSLRGDGLRIGGTKVSLEGHTHDDRYLKLSGGTMSGTISRRSGGSTIRGRDHAIIRQTYAPGGSSWNPIACVDTETGTWTLGHLSSGDSDTNFHFCFSTNVDYNAGNNNGNYVTLRNIAGTIALTSEIPDKNSWNYDDRYYTKAESNAKYITDITTSVNKLTFTKNGTNIDKTITVNNVQSLGRRSPLTERNAISGIYTYGTYSKEDNLAPANYFETLGFGEGTAGTIEIGGSWISGGELFWRALRDCCEDWFSWKTILDSSNYSGILDSRYYTESEVNSLLSTKLDRVNLSTGGWNPRGYNLAADYCYNGGDLSISESGGQIHVSVDGYFWQNEGQYRVLDVSDIAGIRGSISVQQYLSNTDTNWYPLVWGGDDHRNTYTSTGAVYKSHDVLSWQTSSQTLYATRLATNSIDLQNNRGIYQVTSKGTSPYKGIQLPDLQSNGLGIFSNVGNGSDEGGIIISEDTSVIYNSFDTGWGLSVRDKDLNYTNISGEDTIAFGVRQDHRAYSLGGFEKSGSSNSYVLLGGGDHKLESSLNVANADTVDYYHADSLFRDLGWWGVNDTHDANDISGNGAVFAYERHSNVPNTGVLVTFRGASDNYRWQMSKSYWSKSLHIRQRNGDNGTWSNWLRLLDESDLTWDNIIGKPSTFTPAAHTHTVFSNNLMIKGTNGISDSASIHLGIGDSDTGFKWISDGVCQIYANNVAIGQWTPGGMNWFANPTVNGNKVWNAGNDGSGSGLDADMLDGYHENSFLRYRGATSTDQEATLWDQIGIKQYGKALPDGLTDVYSYGSVISLPGPGSRFEIYASHIASAGNGLYYRSGWNDDKRPWLKFIDSSNIGSQSVNYANSAGNADTVDGVHMDWHTNYTVGDYLAIWDNAGNCIRPIPKGSTSVGYATSAGNADTVDGYHATDGRTFNGNINWGSWGDDWSDGTNKHPWYGFDHRYPNTGAYSTTITDYFGMTIKTANTLRLDFGNLLLNGTSIYDINVASATKLQTARNLWGQSFNGTSDVNGTIYINNSDSSNGAIRLNNNVNANARISAIGGQVIFNTGAAIRFGETTWDWNKWAGLKYDSSIKTIYLGIADDSVFNANSAQGGGTINLKAGISTIEAPNISFGNATSGLCNGLEWTCGDNDFARIKAGAGGGSDGYLEIATADDGTEPIYVRQYTGNFKTIARTFTLLDANGNTHIPKQIIREASSRSWVEGRAGALLRETTSTGYHTLWSLKTTNGSWDFGEYNTPGWNNVPVMSYVTDSDFNAGNNTTTHQIKFPLDSGTVALTKNIPSKLPADGGNADTVDGYHANGLFTAFGNNGHNITATIGGVTKSFLVNYAADADKVDGYHVNTGQSPFGRVPTIGDDGVMEIGKYIDFHNDNGGKYDYSTRLQSTGNHQNTLNLPSKSGTLALTSDIKDTNTWRPISDDYEKGDGSTSLSTLGSLTLYNDLLGSIPNPTNYYWANVKVSSISSTTTSPTVNVLTATRVCAGHDPGISNSISCSNWFRSSGETGWYSSTYGGGWYMSDKDWIRSWGSKALYINNSIRSTNYQVMYGSTVASAAKLESTTTLVYGTDTSSNSINSYLRGTTVTLQVKKGTSINHNALQLTADYIYCNNYCDMKQGAVVSGGNFTVNNNSYLAQSSDAKVGIGTGSPSCLLDVSGLAKVYQLGIWGTPDANTQLYVNGHSKLLDLYLNAYRDKYFKQPVCLEFITFKGYAINSTIWSSPKSSKTNDVVVLEIPNLSVPDKYKVFVFVTSDSSPNIYASIVQTAPLLLNIVTGGVSNTGQFAIMIWAIPT